MIDLKLFCTDIEDYGYDLKEPFSDDRYTYATERRTIIRIDRVPAITKPIPERIAEQMKSSGLDFDNSMISVWHDIPSFPEGAEKKACPCCKGTGKVDECSQCGGAGEDCGGGECHICGGYANVPGDAHTCWFCDGMKRIYDRKDFVEIEGYRLNLNLLEKLKTLPGVKLGFLPLPDEYTFPAIKVKFEGGCGLLMPMRKD